MTSNMFDRPNPATLGDAVQFDIVARETGRVYRVQMLKPNAPPPSAGYPVAWFTDGNSNFCVAATQMWVRAGMELEPAIIVGVGYPETDYATMHRRRTLDLTPPTPPERSPFGDLPTGGAQAFERFIVEEIRQNLGHRYPIDLGRQAIFGHSLGGLFVLSCLVRNPTAFSHYVASSPSIWWNEASIVDEIEISLRRKESDRGRPQILLAAGGSEEIGARNFPGATPENVAAHQANVDKAGIIRRAKALASRLEANRVPVEFALFPGEGHVSVLPGAIARAMDFFLSYERLGSAPVN